MSSTLPTLLIACLMALSLQGNCQSREYPWSIGIQPSFFLFLNSEDKNPGTLGDFDPGFGISLKRYLNTSFDLEFNPSIALVTHPAENPLPNGFIRKTNFFAGNLNLKYKFNNGYLLDEKALLAPFFQTGVSSYYSGSSDQWSFTLPVGVGLQFRLEKNLTAFFSSSYQIGFDDYGSYLAHQVGIAVSFGDTQGKSWKNPLSDLDKDGIPDIRDECPGIPGSRKGYGCPDRDGDGVLDDLDECPDKFGYANLNGCNDIDGDGISDPLDQCPELYGPISRRGCPVQDRDKDQIPDEEDLCPEIPGPISAKGCPDQDRDGVRDEEDQCKEVFGKAEFGGCPYDQEKMARIKEPGKVEAVDSTSKAPVDPKKIEEPDPELPEISNCEAASFILSEISSSIAFEKNRSAFTNSSYPGLERLTSFLENCPEGKLLIWVRSEEDSPFSKTLAFSRSIQIKKWLSSRLPNTIQLEVIKENPESKDSGKRVVLLKN